MPAGPALRPSTASTAAGVHLHLHILPPGIFSLTINETIGPAPNHTYHKVQ